MPGNAGAEDLTASNCSKNTGTGQSQDLHKTLRSPRSIPIPPLSGEKYSTCNRTDHFLALPRAINTYSSNVVCRECSISRGLSACGRPPLKRHLEVVVFSHGKLGPRGIKIQPLKAQFKQRSPFAYVWVRRKADSTTSGTFAGIRPNTLERRTRDPHSS
jgi:hypothetical protein